MNYISSGPQPNIQIRILYYYFFFKETTERNAVVSTKSYFWWSYYSGGRILQPSYSHLERTQIRFFLTIGLLLFVFVFFCFLTFADIVFFCFQLFAEYIFFLNSASHNRHERLMIQIILNFFISKKGSCSNMNPNSIFITTNLTTFQIAKLR